MTRTMVRYKVRPDQAALNEELIRGVFEELRELRPETLSYQVFVLDDGVSVVHIVEYEGPTHCQDWLRSSATTLASASAWRTGRSSASCARSGRSPAVRRPPRLIGRLQATYPDHGSFSASLFPRKRTTVRNESGGT